MRTKEVQFSVKTEICLPQWMSAANYSGCYWNSRRNSTRCCNNILCKYSALWGKALLLFAL